MILPDAEPAACRAFFGDIPRTVERLPRSGFSGSDLVLVKLPASVGVGHRDRWVVKSFGPGTSRDHALWVHGLMGHLRREGIEVVPDVRRVAMMPMDAPLAGGRAVAATVVEDDGGGLWEAVQFLLGRPVAVPDGERRAAAMECLAAIHAAAATLPGAQPRRMRSRGLVERIDRATSLRERSWRERWRGEAGREPRSRDGEPIARVFDQAIESFAKQGDAALERITRFASVEAPCQAVLRDIWSDHVLFEGGRVSGVIDYHAAGIDTVATDLARLIGSWQLASGDAFTAAAWHECLAAYESVRPLHDDERRLVAFLHHTGVIVSVDNWFRWLVEERRAFPDTAAVASRLGQLVAALPESIAAVAIRG